MASALPDLFGSAPAPAPAKRAEAPARRAPAATPVSPLTAAPASQPQPSADRLTGFAEPNGTVWPDFRSEAWLRCPCGAFASLSFGTFPRAGMLGVRRCVACAKRKGRL